MQMKDPAGMKPKAEFCSFLPYIFPRRAPIVTECTKHTR